MLGIAIAGLLNAALGGAIFTDAFEASEPAPMALVLAANVELATPDAEPAASHLARFEIAPGSSGDYLARLGLAGGLAAKINGVACLLSRPNGVSLTPTDRAPHAPSFFLTVTVGSCHG
jgi:hypothetical protein